MRPCQRYKCLRSDTMPRKKKVPEPDDYTLEKALEEELKDEIEAQMVSKSEKTVVKEVVDTAVKESKDRIKKYLELGKTLAPDLRKRAKAMGFEDPAEYLKAALDFYDYYRDKVEALEDHLKQCRAEVAMLAYLRPNIWKAYIARKMEKVEALRMAGLISPEEFIAQLNMLKALLNGGNYGGGRT